MLLTEQCLEIQSFNGGCTGSSDATIDLSKCYIVGYHVSRQGVYVNEISILLEFSLTVKAAPHECVIRTSLL